MKDLPMNAVAKVVPLRNDNDEDPDPIASLVAERKRVSDELARLAAIDAPVREAEAAVGGIDRAISTLDSDDRSCFEEWATGGGVGAPPASRNIERAGLVRRRLELQSDVDSARNRSAAVAPRRVTLNGELRRIDHMIFAEKLRGAVKEAHRLDAEAHEMALEMRAPIAKVVALKMILAGETMNSAQNSGDQPAVRLIGEAIATLSGLAMPEIGGDSASLPSFVTEWRRALT
jgi:hypothetical protein